MSELQHEGHEEHKIAFRTALALNLSPLEEQMKIVVRAQNGIKTELSAESLVLYLGGSEIELSEIANSKRIQLHMPSDGEAVHVFVLHPRASNTMDIEVAEIPRT